MKPSTEAVLAHLERHGVITGLDALRQLGVYRLSARINELREDGVAIQTTFKRQNGKRFAEYRYEREGE
jgi:hypothetical protein